jgi:hypothetical protein
MATNVVNDEDTDVEYEDPQITLNAMQRGVNIIPTTVRRNDINSARRMRDEQRNARLRGVNVIEQYQDQEGGKTHKRKTHKRKRKTNKRRKSKRNKRR